MKYFFLVRSGLWRSRTRTILTLLSAAIAFLLFGVLQGIDTYLRQAVDHGHLNILVTNNLGGQPLPIAYLTHLKSVPGVERVSYMTAMGGYYRARSNIVAVIGTDPASFFSVDLDMKTSPADKKALLQTPTGALVTPAFARKFGWNRGDRISLHSVGTPQKSGSLDWSFQIVGFLDLESQPGAQLLVANYDYIDMARASNAGTVMQYLSLIGSPAQGGAISAAIDNMFVNSPVPTRTMNQKDLAQSTFAAVGNIDFFLDAITAAVFFTLLLLVGNALMQSFRERVREFAVLKTLGFSDAGVAALVTGEALLLCVTAAILGLTGAWYALPAFGAAIGGGGLVPHPPLFALAMGLVAAILVGLVCGAIPAWQARRLTIIDALAAH